MPTTSAKKSFAPSLTSLRLDADRQKFYALGIRGTWLFWPRQFPSDVALTWSLGTPCPTSILTTFHLCFTSKCCTTYPAYLLILPRLPNILRHPTVWLYFRSCISDLLCFSLSFSWRIASAVLLYPFVITFTKALKPLVWTSLSIYFISLIYFIECP